jgi:hypothetical protein
MFAPAAEFEIGPPSRSRSSCELRRKRSRPCAKSGSAIHSKETGRPVQFEITEQTRAAIQAWLPKVDARNGTYLFPSRFRARPHLSTRQYARIVHGWVASAGLDGSAYGTHSMRRTKAAQIYDAEVADRAFELRMTQRVGFVLRISFLIENQRPVAHRSVLAVAMGCAGR